MKTFLVVATLLLLSHFAVAKSDTAEAISVLKAVDGSFYSVKGLISGALAQATYSDTIKSQGWGKLNVKAGEGSDEDVIFAAGFAEGYLTAFAIEEHHHNIQDSLYTSNDSKALVENFMNEQNSFFDKMIKENPSDSYWKGVNMLNLQLEGVYQGQAAANKKGAVSKFDLWSLNAAGDLLDLVHAVNPSQRPEYHKMSKEELFSAVLFSSHCSALVKVTPGLDDIYFGHSTWYIYNSMVRVYKSYDFSTIKSDTIVNGRMSFSSYPGCLESIDDFYIIGEHMAMIQTTNNVFNTSLYDNVKPESLLAWHRVRLSSWMAKSGKEWAEIFARHNSGTYNNQYMVLDFDKFEVGKEIHEGLLYVVEQIPGLVEYSDETAILRRGYWPSYNVPFFKSIYDQSGYPAVVEKYGLSYSYQMAPRAKIFRRDSHLVSDLDGIKQILRSNDYKNDPFSEGNPANAICSRVDLDDSRPASQRLVGCYDTKVSSYSLYVLFDLEPSLSPLPPPRLAPFG
mmetsp:Transcript_36111/g.93933  ORF Transcript_36111/g.93933 Transcript_36111/m.93933 type:complete len:509 (-) Transcript_36111:694-2220(-)